MSSPPRRRADRLEACLPGLCVAGGLVAVFRLHNALGLASGVLLVAAGLAVLLLRRLERRARLRELLEHHTSFVPAPSRLALTTDHVRAILPQRLGHQDIDRQHRGLAARAATLRVALFHNDEQAEIELLVHELIDAMTRHVQDEVDALARLGVVRADPDLDADRMEIASAEYDFHVYCCGEMSLEALVERVTEGLVGAHLASRHPALPCMESALMQLRGARA